MFSYCCLNSVCILFQSKTIGLHDSYHNLAFPTKVKQNLWTLTPSRNAWVSIQSLVLRKCASTHSSGFSENSDLKWDQFNCGIGPGWTGLIASCVGATTGCAGGAGGCTGGTGVLQVVQQGGADVPVVLYKPIWFKFYILEKRLLDLISVLNN